jgi:PAS domain S-box-containing protein
MLAPSETEATPIPERSWQRYRLIADTTTDVVYESDSAGIIQWISPSVHELLGWAPIQLQGRPANDLIHPLDRDRIEALRASLYLDGAAHDDVTCMVSTASGGYREVRLTTRPLLDAQGTVIGTIVTVTDTHDRDSALRALATLSQANRTLVRATDETTLLLQMCETIVGTGRYLFTWYGRPVDDAQQSVQPIAIAGEHQGYLDEVQISWGDNPLGRGPSGRAVRTRCTQVENDFQPDPEYQPWFRAATNHGFRSSIVLPIIVGEELDGVLMVYAAEVGAFDAHAQDLLEDLAADLGYGLQRLRAIHERDVAVARLTESEHQFRLLAENASDVILLSTADMTITWVSPSAEQALGYSVHDIVGRNAAFLIHPDDLPHVVAEVQRTDATKTNLQVRHRLTHADGHTFWVDVSAGHIDDDGTGSPGRVVSIRDVDAQALAEQELAAREVQYRLLAENASDVVWQVAPDGSLEWTSPSITRVLGWAPEDVLGTVAMDLVDPEDRDRAKQERQQVLAGRSHEGEFRMRRADGRTQWMALTVHPVSTTAGVSRILALRDIQDEVSARTQLEFASRPRSDDRAARTRGNDRPRRVRAVIAGRASRHCGPVHRHRRLARGQ